MSRAHPYFPLSAAPFVGQSWAEPGAEGMATRAPPILTNLCPYLAQVHSSRLRLPQVSPADSGEYVCRVENDSGPKEASIIVSVLHSRHPGPGYTPGEEPEGLGEG